MSTVSVRYIVDDVDEAIPFYGELGFGVDFHPAPGFAILSRGDLRLLLNAVSAGGGAAQPGLDGSAPEPGGWNRFQIEVDDLEATVEAMRDAGTRFRTEVAHGRGGDQILVDDPSGNPVELMQPAG